MPRTRSATFYEHIVNVEGLPDELREKILTNLTLSELMALECVSKRWQRNVTGVLKGIKILTVANRGESTRYLKFSCGHRISQCSKIICGPKDRERVIRLMAKMTNLVAVRLPAFLESKALMSVLENCSKLEHVVFSQFAETVIPNSLRPKLTCLSIHSKLPSGTITEMSALKNFHYRLGEFDHIPLDQLSTLLNNGLIELKTRIRYDHIGAVCKLGSRLESLDVHCFFDGDAQIEGDMMVSSKDIRLIVSSLPRLKALSVNMPYSCMSMLKDLEKLEHLSIRIVPAHEADSVTSSLAEFGYRLKSLLLGSVPTNRKIEDFAFACPNLESFTVLFNYSRPSPSALIPMLLRMSKLRHLNIAYDDWTAEQIVELWQGLSTLRKVDGRVRTTIKEMANLERLVKQELPKLDISLISFIPR